jgi:histidinol dehydrogenase
MRIMEAGDRTAIDRLVRIDRARDGRVEEQVARIVDNVRRGGDRALRSWSRKLDGLTGPMEVSRRERDNGWRRTPRPVRAAIREAVRNVRRVSERQVPAAFSVTVRPGVRIVQRVQPLGRVGCYVPAGRFPLPSTVIMTVVPARVAGVGEVLVVCPRPDDAILCAAVEAGADQVWRVGGAHAIAALAYGTASLARVDKIVGPGSAWVTAAKVLVSRDVGIDFPAGPSEIAVLSTSGRADWIAADLVAQAEHDERARAIFVTTRRMLAREVQRHVAAMAPAGTTARRALGRNGAIVIAPSESAAVALVNRLAPEHLVCDRPEIAGRCVTAGTVFVGRWSAQAAGDYCTGSNHVLPTGGTARWRGGLSAADFVRTYTVQTLTRQGLRTIGPSAVALADAEGLAAHASSIRLRIPS